MYLTKMKDCGNGDYLEMLKRFIPVVLPITSTVELNYNYSICPLFWQSWAVTFNLPSFARQDGI
jgi:hypothetical protein